MCQRKWDSDIVLENVVENISVGKKQGYELDSKMQD